MESPWRPQYVGLPDPLVMTSISLQVWIASSRVGDRTRTTGQPWRCAMLQESIGVLFGCPHDLLDYWLLVICSMILNIETIHNHNLSVNIYIYLFSRLPPMLMDNQPTNHCGPACAVGPAKKGLAGQPRNSKRAILGWWPKSQVVARPIEIATSQWLISCCRFCFWCTYHSGDSPAFTQGYQESLKIIGILLLVWVWTADTLIFL